MRPTSLSTPAILLAAFVTFLPTGASAQQFGYGAGEGRFLYTWSNMGVVGQGDTLVIRQVMINTGDSVAAVTEPNCGLDLSTSAALRSLEEDCAASADVLSPGDSVWAENRWIVQSPPGRYQYQIQGAFGSSSGSWNVPESTHRRTHATPPSRLAIVLHSSIEPSDIHVTEWELQSAIGHAVSHPDYFHLFVTAEAATAMQPVAPRLELHIELDGTGAFAFGACWFGRGGKPINRDCERKTAGIASPVALGVLLGEFIDNELQWAGARLR